MHVPRSCNHIIPYFSIRLLNNLQMYLGTDVDEMEPTQIPINKAKYFITRGQPKSMLGKCEEVDVAPV